MAQRGRALSPVSTLTAAQAYSEPKLGITNIYNFKANISLTSFKLDVEYNFLKYLKCILENR